MPSKRPKIVIYTDNEIIEKIQDLAKKENRSVSNYVENLLKEKIKESDRKIEID